MERTLENLEQELKSEHNLYLRALADFENYRRRIDREREQLGKEGLRKFLLPLLDVIDDFERFLKAVENESSPFINGMRVVHSKLMQVLEAEDVLPFKSIGERFDPFLHEAIATATADEHPLSTIVEEVRRGYRWRDDVLRTARVVVAM
jgi:molecular chaperone GrpE